jgi:hypothetical protein
VVNKSNLSKKVEGMLCGMLLIFVSMNIIIFSSPNVSAEGGGLEIHLNEIGFSTEFSSTLSTTLYCPRFEQNSNWETQIVLTNPDENDTNIIIEYYCEGVLIGQINDLIISKNTISFTSNQHNIYEQTGSVVISSDIPIFGNVIYYSSYCAAAETLQTSSSSTLYCPGFYQTIDWDTWICINNVDSCANEVTITYYNEYGTEIDTIIDTLSSNENRYFRPSDDGIESTFGSIIIDSGINDVLNGYVLKVNSDSTKAYSYILSNELNNYHCTEFITNDFNTNELVFFNPEPEIKNINLNFYDETGTLINSITNQELSSYETINLLINDFDEGKPFGSIYIESDCNGIVGYFGHIGPNYGTANSINKKSGDSFYCSFGSYNGFHDESIILLNPIEDEIEIEMTFFGENDEEVENQTEAFSSISQFSGKITCELSGAGIYPIYYNPPSWADCTVPPPGFPGGPEEYGYNPNWWSSPDTDSDGLQDHIEDSLFPMTQPPMDTDNDGTPDGRNDPDTDGDGLPDGWEYFRLFGKTSIITSTGVHGYYGDAESQAGDTLDGFMNWEERNYKTNPKVFDTDGDRLSELREVYTDLTDPLDADSDDDKLCDGDEVLTWGTNPNNADHDGDGMPDGWEVFKGVGLSFNSPDPRVSDPYSDPDTDQLLNIDEFNENTHPNIEDTDQDGRPDGPEVDNNLDPLENDIKWAFLVYMNADNNLIPFGHNDMVEMREVGSTDDITVAVQWDGIYDSAYQAESNYWAKTKRFVFFEGNDGFDSYELDDLGEKNMGDGNTFLSFLNWGLNTFPADKYAVILWNHGAGWAGFSFDETSNDDYLTLSEISSAFESVSTYFDLIGFAGCIMGTPEVFYQIRNRADVAVAHASSIYDEAWPYDTILTNLNNNPTWSASQFGKQIVTDFIGDTSLPEYVSACAVDLSKIDYTIENPLHYLSYYLKNGMEDSNYGSYYKNIFDSALSFPDEYNDDYDLRDLYYFADWLSNPNNVAQKDSGDTYAINIRTQANYLKTYLIDGTQSQKCIIKEAHGSSLSNSKGFNIYIPEDSSNWDDYKNMYSNIYFSSATNWDDMLDARYQ